MLAKVDEVCHTCKMIERHLQSYIVDLFLSKDQPQGLILAGIVGVGKTTLIEMSLKKLAIEFQIFHFSGDDTVFRNDVKADSKFIYNFVLGKTEKKALVFVDEVQKCEEVFDSLKYFMDHGNGNFIVSGSNPEFLHTKAQSRLKRRADFKVLYPLSLAEILGLKSFSEGVNKFKKILSGSWPTNFETNSLTPSQKASIDKYFSVGGLPLAYLQENPKDSLAQVQASFDRGFEPIRFDTHNISDTVAIELSKLHSMEFTYKEIMALTRINNRKIINEIISQLLSHGYLGQVLPYVFDGTKRTYLRKYFYTDIGIANYLSGDLDFKKSIGFKVEGYVYARLMDHLQVIPTKNKNIFFYKNYIQSESGALRFSKGEVDAVVQIGSKIIPIEIKASSQWNKIDTTQLEELIKKHDLEKGIVLYMGEPHWKKNILFWPIWMI
jgi:predicted AAA+ superfamily ATPase